MYIIYIMEVYILMKEKMLTLKLLKDKYGVCRLDNTLPIPEWAEKGEFFSATRTSDELSIVCCEKNIPEDIKCEKNWRILKIEGPLDFSLIGILASISSILAERKISIFAVSTYDTDYILIRDSDVNDAVEALSAQKYNIV